MRTSIRSAGVLAAAAACALVALPAGTAGAATMGDKPAPKAAAPAPPPTGLITICNHSGYMFDVYADGPSIREDDLAGSFDECTDWEPMLTGSYDVGFALRVPSQQNILIQARFKREGHVYYKVFNGQGVVGAKIGKDEHTRVDLYIPRA